MNRDEDIRPPDQYPSGLMGRSSVAIVDGAKTVDGVPVPSYIVGEADLTRWSDAQKVACDLLGLPATSEGVWMLTRELYGNPESYPS